MPRQKFQVQTRPANQVCRNCGLIWSANHKNKTCNKTGLQNHFARACRKPISKSTKSARPNVYSIHDNTNDNSFNAVSNVICNTEMQILLR